MSQPPPPPPGGYGSPPPPPPSGGDGGGYGGPPSGGDGGGYGAPPPGGGYGGPPQGGYGGPPAGSSGWSVGNAVSYGWAKFQTNVGQIVIAGLIAFVGVVLFQVVGVVIRNVIVQEPECRGSGLSFTCDDGSGFFVQLIASAIMSFLFFVVYQVIGAGIIRGSLGITEGREFRYDELFRTDRIVPIIVTSVISAAIISVGIVLCVLPGIVAAFMLSYAPYFVIDKGLAPMAAITASFNLVKDNLGEALVWAIVSYAIVLAGAILCGVGLIVAIPVSIIGTAFTYKLLTGQQVAA